MYYVTVLGHWWIDSYCNKRAGKKKPLMCNNLYIRTCLMI